MLLATLLLGRSLGPEVQGQFSSVKSGIEFLAAFAMLGLPQALFYYVKAGRLPMRMAQRWSWGSGALALLLGTAYGWMQGYGWCGFALLLGVGVAACVVHGQFRGLLLGGHLTVFNAITALPQVLVLLGAIAVVMLSAGAAQRPVWMVLFAVVYVIAALGAWWCLQLMEPVQAVQAASFAEVGSYGLASWLTASLATSAILAVQHWIEATQGRVLLGQFTMAMVLVQVPLTPVNYATPLLFRHWAGQAQFNTALRWAAWLFAGLAAFAALLWGVSHLWPTLGLGAAYAGISRALAVLLLGVAAEAAARVLAAHANATGTPWVMVQAEALRWLVLLAAGWWFAPASLVAICTVWVAAAGAAAGVIALHGYGGAVLAKRK